MNERIQIECAEKSDREALALILVRNGYTVRWCKAKKPGGNGYTHYIEYWKGGKQDNA